MDKVSGILHLCGPTAPNSHLVTMHGFRSTPYDIQNTDYHTDKTTIVMTVVVVVIVVVLSVVLLVAIWGRQPPHLILAVALRLPYLAAVLEGLKRAATLGWFDRRIRSTKPPGRKSKAASPDKGHHGSAPEATCTFM